MLLCSPGLHYSGADRIEKGQSQRHSKSRTYRTGKLGPSECRAKEVREQARLPDSGSASRECAIQSDKEHGGQGRVLN